MAALARIASRRLISVSGQDAQAFLQGLVTVDMRKLVDGKLVAGAFLNAKGRILYDVLVAKRASNDGFDIEANAESVEELVTMLRRYKLRKKVTVSQDDPRKVFAFWNKGEPKGNSDSEQYFADPRPGHTLGYRVWTSANEPSVASSARQIDEIVYQQIRVASGLAEGPAETADELPFILNFDWWPSALAFDKGCYTGQELVARTHFKGQVRRRAVPIVLSIAPSTKPDELLPSYALWPINKPTSSTIPPLKSVLEPIPGVTSPVGEGTLLSMAPGGLNIGLAAFKEAQSLPVPGSEFKPTHHIKLENGETVECCPVRPAWWPATESV